MDRVIDQHFSGLYAPRNMGSMGRIDLAAEDRPGPYLIAIVQGMTRDGVFNYKSDAAPSVRVAAPTPDFAPQPSRDVRAPDWFDDDPGYRN